MTRSSGARRDWLRLSLILIAVLYAAFSGLRTVGDFDLGWQMATGRYIVQHREIPSKELFSYTAQGNEWIYPPISGVIFYLLHWMGGFSALTWLHATACAATVAIVATQGGSLTAALGAIAVPAIAFRTLPRAELFTTVLFAAVLCLLWRHHEDKPARLWLLPLLFLFWVNLHLGFVAGLGLLGAYALFELCEMALADRRAAAVARFKAAAPWMLAAALATLVNPWGYRIYQAIYRQQEATKLHTAVIGEWSGVHFNSLALWQAMDARNPASGGWWLLVVGAITIVACFAKKRFGPAVLLAASLYLSVQHIRFQALFAIVVVVLGGAILASLSLGIAMRRRGSATALEPAQPQRLSPLYGGVLAALFVVFTGIRIADLVSNRYYLDSGQISLFGAGPSWWFPERAAEFLLRNKLPGNVFHDYNLGGYLAWRIGPQYPDFVDGRYIPFGVALFAEQRSLLSLPPDSGEWQKAAHHWQINTLIFSTSRYAGLGNFPLMQFCKSQMWKPVYLDDVSILLVRNTPENAGVIRQLGIRCEAAPLLAPPATTGNSLRARAERFNYLMNAASIEFVLARDAEAFVAIQQAEQLYPENPHLHLAKAQLLQANYRGAEAESEYLHSLRGGPSDAAWYALARLYAAEHRYPDAVRCVTEAAALSQVPHERWLALGRLYLAMNQPKDAVSAFDRAERTSPYREDVSGLGNGFNAQLAEGRAAARKAIQGLYPTVAQ